MITKYCLEFLTELIFLCSCQKPRPSRKTLRNQDRPREQTQGHLGSANKMDSVQQTMMSEEERQGL